MKNDLKSMTRKELEKLRSDIDKALERLVAEEKKKAIEAAEKAARAHGFSLSDLAGDAKAPVKKPRKPMPKPAPKYKNPANPEQTWTGRGRQPVWFREALAAGKSPDDLAI